MKQRYRQLKNLLFFQGETEKEIRNDLESKLTASTFRMHERNKQIN